MDYLLNEFASAASPAVWQDYPGSRKTAHATASLTASSAEFHGLLEAGAAMALGKLLDDAERALAPDSNAARFCIARASALLQAAFDHQPPNHQAELPGVLAPWQLRRAKAHIEGNLESQLRIEDLGAITRLSPGYFSRAFKRSVGESPRSYIANRRILRAQQMMLTTDEPLAHIALACGLYDQAHLCKMFRQLTGQSPNGWRRRHAVRGAGSGLAER